MLRSNAVENKQLKICGRSTFTVAGNLVHNCLIAEINDYALMQHFLELNKNRESFITLTSDRSHITVQLCMFEAYSWHGSTV